MGNIPGGNFPGRGEGGLIGGNFPGGSFPDTGNSKLEKYVSQKVKVIFLPKEKVKLKIYWHAR